MSAPGRLDRPKTDGVILHRFLPAAVQTVGELEFGGTAGSGDLLPDDGYALDPKGADFSRLQSGTAPLLWAHDTDLIIGRVLSIRVAGNVFPFRATFPAPGASAFADEKRQLLKAGAINGVSLGFVIDASEPIDPRRPNGGRRATKWRGLEISLCAMPVDPKGVVTERARRNMDAITKAQLAATTAQDEHRAGSRHHAAIAESLERLDEHRRAVGGHLRAFQQALEAKNDQQAQECQARCRRSMQGVERELRAIGDRHLDATDAHQALCRAMNDCWTALGADSGPVTSKGLNDTEPQLDAQGSRSQSADYKRRQRDLDSAKLAMSSSDEEYTRRQREAEALGLAHTPK
jgi:hypothetical protein